MRTILDDVEPARPSPFASAPEITHLNERYAGALALAELIRRSTSFTTSRGEVPSVAFVFDMRAPQHVGDLRRAARVAWQYLRGKAHPLPGLRIAAAVMDARRPQRDRARADGHPPLLRAAVAANEPVPVAT